MEMCANFDYLDELVALSTTPVMVACTPFIWMVLSIGSPETSMCCAPLHGPDRVLGPFKSAMAHICPHGGWGELHCCLSPTDCSRCPTASRLSSFLRIADTKHNFPTQSGSQSSVISCHPGLEAILYVCRAIESLSESSANSWPPGPALECH
jgi:hypothetical protein